MERKAALPQQLGNLKAKKSKEKKAKSPFNTKVLLKVSRIGDIYRDSKKIYLKIHVAKYPRLLAEIIEFNGAMALHVRDRKPDDRYYKFNLWLLENTKAENIMFEKEGEFFLIPVQRIRSSGLHVKVVNTGIHPIDQQLKFPYQMMNLYRLKDVTEI